MPTTPGNLRTSATLLLLLSTLLACIDVPDLENNPSEPGNTADGGPVNGTEPILTQTTPRDGTTHVALDTLIALKFSESMHPERVELIFEPGVAQGGQVWTENDTLLTLTTTSRLNPNTGYKVKVNGTSRSGTALNGMTSFSFTTTGSAPDLTPPTILHFTPENNAIGIARDATITFSFSEPMDKASVESALSISDTAGPIPGSFAWNSASSELKFKPTQILTYGMNVTWRVAATAQDKAGNAAVSTSTGTFRVNRIATAQIDFDPGTSGGLGAPNYGRTAFYNGAYLGDDSTNESYRLFLGFRLDSLPNNLTQIHQARVKWWVSSVSGSPFEKFGRLLLEPVDVGETIELSWEVIDPRTVADYEAQPLAPAMEIPTSVTSTQGDFEVTQWLLRDWADRSIRNKRSQYRLRFEQPSDGNNQRDYLLCDVDIHPKLAELWVTYEYP